MPLCHTLTAGRLILHAKNTTLKRLQDDFYFNIVAGSARAKAVLITPFFFDVSNVRSYKQSPAVVPLMEEKTKTEQDERGGVAVNKNNAASKKTEIGDAERTAKMLKDEIKSLDGGQHVAVIFEASLKQGEAKHILELADTTHRQLEATIEDSYAQLRRITGLTALD